MVSVYYVSFFTYLLKIYLFFWIIHLFKLLKAELFVGWFRNPLHSGSKRHQHTVCTEWDLETVCWDALDNIWQNDIVGYSTCCARGPPQHNCWWNVPLPLLTPASCRPWLDELACRSVFSTLSQFRSFSFYLTDIKQINGLLPCVSWIQTSAALLCLPRLLSTPFFSRLLFLSLLHRLIDSQIDGVPIPPLAVCTNPHPELPLDNLKFTATLLCLILSCHLSDSLNICV